VVKSHLLYIGATSPENKNLVDLEGVEPPLHSNRLCVLPLNNRSINLVGGVGVEPTTFRLSVECSAKTELPASIYLFMYFGVTVRTEYNTLLGFLQ
jgi:hypothetical protein